MESMSFQDACSAITESRLTVFQGEPTVFSAGIWGFEGIIEHAIVADKDSLRFARE